MQYDLSSPHQRDGHNAPNNLALSGYVDDHGLMDELSIVCHRLEPRIFHNLSACDMASSLRSLRCQKYL